jgi:protein HOOK3
MSTSMSYLQVIFGRKQILFLRDDRFYQTQSDRSRIWQEKEALDKVYQELVEEHRTLQASVEDLTAEKEDALSKARQATQDIERHRDDGRAEPNHALRGELDRLRTELLVLPLHE